MDAFLITFLSIIFLSIGSLTSVLIHRLILMEFQKTDINLFFPPSHCINCGAKISLINLIPILGYVLQRGRCIKCNASISITYLMHEIIHLVVGLSIYLFEGFSYQALITYILFSILYILLICDLKKFYLPLYLNLSITLVGIISGFFGIALIEDYGFLNISNISLSLIGFIFGYFFLWSINLIYKLLKKEDGIGGGDFILLGGIGSIVGPLSIASIILLGSLSTLIIMIFNHKKYAKELPLGAGLIFGLFVYIIFEYFELFPFMYVI